MESEPGVKRGRRVLIADDSATARMFVQRCLEIAGLADAEFAEAPDGREALEALKERPADLLVTDLTMPGMDGRELVRRVAASPFLNGTPVLVVTSQTNPALEEELRPFGVRAVLPKPVTPAALVGLIETLFDEETP